ncbi:nucleotide 5'-monophosphate nucleosidase PpnN [Paraferrimonas sedimenticola]|uniref:AMP nucleosidase n=1 Tax=Paraferrimonas sedimenticola TaxID=375674 RepID=A0AA37RTW6_9GAMM|nr:nucleotide 5'-monophosphate nucleosidase PpnN [Paraferrimonas sedimenticola]GLP95224.1 LOG family protein [Paraferrimonas sedimenticola]
MIVTISPRGSMDQLSQLEIESLKLNAQSHLYQLYRRCSLAVLASGLNSDNADDLFDQYKDFDIRLIRRERGIQIELINPPVEAFVDGKIMRGIQEHLFAVLRDILFVEDKYRDRPKDSALLTNEVFDVLRNARLLKLEQDPNMVVCWGGHSINDIEYKYTKEVGYQLGLRDLDVCTGCGPGAMKGPMKGAAIGHAKQRNPDSRFVGLTEPSIIAAEPPNQIVNQLVIMPDIEKRLEAFVRLGHGVIIFPGGVGTAEEFLYLLGIKLHPENRGHPLPLILTGPESSRAYFEEIDAFIGATLGEEAQALYQIVIDEPATVAQLMFAGIENVRGHRKAVGDSYQFNWSLKIDDDFQQPFIPNHDNMAALAIQPELPKAQLAANLRRVFSGLVAGNVKSDAMRLVEQHGPFELTGDPSIMAKMDKLLAAFVKQQRMKLPGSDYQPCYRIRES